MKAVSAIVLLMFLASAGGWAAEPPSPDLAAKVDAYVQPFVESNNFSGVILIAQGNKVLVRKAYGLANYELGVANTPDTKFQIASVSKSFTALAILLLEERGKLSVSDPLSRYIPDYPNGEKITLHHLLTHTSGIPNINAMPEYTQKSRFPATTAQLVEIFKNKPADFAPGARYSYSNSNYNLLAFILEKVSGESYGDFLRANILEPLGMNNTAHPRAGEILTLRASGYQPLRMKEVENAPYLDWSSKTGNGSLYSTVDDLYRFDRALYGDRLLKPATRARMFSEQAAGVGYGWFVRKNLNRRVTAITGRSPGFTSSLERFVDDDLCVIVLANLYTSITQSMASDLAAIALGEKYTPALVSGAIPPGAQQAASYTGKYQLGPDFQFNPNLQVSVEREGENLVMRMAAGDSYLIPQSENAFVDRVYGGRVTFAAGADGKITHFTWNFGRDYVAQRVP